MSVKDPAWLAQHLRSGKKVLILAGALCDQIQLEDKGLLDYVVEIANKAKAPVAATGNTVTGLRAKGLNTNKAWAIEMVNFMRYDWHNPVIDGKPDIMVFIGYNQTLASNLTSAVQGAETIVLGNTYVPEATYSLPDTTSFKEWQKELSDLVKALGK